MRSDSRFQLAAISDQLTAGPTLCPSERDCFAHFNPLFSRKSSGDFLQQRNCLREAGLWRAFAETKHNRIEIARGSTCTLGNFMKKCWWTRIDSCIDRAGSVAFSALVGFVPITIFEKLLLAGFLPIIVAGALAPHFRPRAAARACLGCRRLHYRRRATDGR
jgi:hypothetical protein